MKNKWIYALIGVVLVGGGLAWVKKSSDGTRGPTASSGAVETCPHQAPKALCFICDPALRDKNRLWCREHARYEDRCWLCHPELEDQKRLFCKEHALYEDECVLCHPEMKPSPSPAGPSAALKCVEHGVMESECGICHPELVETLKVGRGVKVRLPSPDSAQLVGVRTSSPSRGAGAKAIECYVELAFNQDRYAEITAPVGGVLKEILADLGAVVTEKQILARIWSAQIAETAAKAVLSHQVLERERALHAKGITSTQALQEAEAAHRAVCQQARALGFSEEEVEAMGRTPDEPVYLEVRSPFGGEIIERHAVRGALVDSGKSLFVVADRDTMWAMLSVPESELSRLRVGQAVEVRIDALPGRTYDGTLTWISAEVDEKNRLGRARAEIRNLDGALKARLFGRARVFSRGTGGVWLVPEGAIQQVGSVSLAFVQVEKDLFEARRVRLGARQAGHWEVVEGLRSGDRVVSTRSFSLKSQLLLSRLGAGCVD